MPIHPKAGTPATRDILIDPVELEQAYCETYPDLEDPNQLVAFGTSGHRGTPGNGTFTEAHIVAITQAICDLRRDREIGGPLFMGKDTHALSAAAQQTALEVLAANGIDVFLQENDGATPTPVISRAILMHNCGRRNDLADGIVISPSHNPPEDGGFKYNPPNGGPAETDITGWVEQRANALLRARNREAKRWPLARARQASTTHYYDYVTPYVDGLKAAIDMELIGRSGLKIGADPLGGASLAYWEPIAAKYGIDITVVNPHVDATFGFMTLDHDGKIRMDCSSPYAMANLVRLKDQYAVAFGNDPDSDRHGIVTRSSGLLNPNHYLAAAIDYLLSHRPEWPAGAAVGKTLVSSSMIDRVVAAHHRQLAEVPVGFKWFADGLFNGSYCFGGEESAGASFLERGGGVWTTDKDGILLNLLAAEITARTGKDPGEHYTELTARFGSPVYRRIDAPATPEQKKALGRLTPEAVTAKELAGEPIEAKITHAAANGAAIGGLKIQSKNGWFAARPSGTENIYKIYAESFRGEPHLDAIIEEAQRIVSAAAGV